VYNFSLSLSYDFYVSNYSLVYVTVSPSSAFKVVGVYPDILNKATSADYLELYVALEPLNTSYYGDVNITLHFVQNVRAQSFGSQPSITRETQTNLPLPLVLLPEKLRTLSLSPLQFKQNLFPAFGVPE
jgi:hypothetical protein